MAKLADLFLIGVGIGIGIENPALNRLDSDSDTNADPDGHIRAKFYQYGTF